jgi:hypothetical protein
VTALTVDVRKEHGLDQPMAVVEGGELHGLVLQGVDRLGGGEHAGHQDLAADVAVELGAGREPKGPELLGVERHGVGIGDEAHGGVLLLPAALGAIGFEHGDRRREVVEPIARAVVGRADAVGGGVHQPEQHGAGPVAGDRVERADLDERAEVGGGEAGAGAEIG